MSASKEYLLSVVIPVYNEASGLAAFHSALIKTLEHSQLESYEIIYCNDGSTDQTVNLISEWHRTQPNVKLITLSRNFGKENALTAGIATATGRAILTIDGDGQHPVEFIPQFVTAWQNGAKVVVGLRSKDSHEGLLKQASSALFYIVFSRLARQDLKPRSTDFRLIDRSVQHAFLQLTETDRMTRGLIDWLGFEPHYITFTPRSRQQGVPGYSSRKLLQLATNSIVSVSHLPLYVFGYLGVFITFGALILGTAVFIEQLLLGDPWHWRFTGTAMLSILLLFLIGVVLMSQGLLSLYISHIHNQTKQRPLYVIDYEHSIGISKTAVA